MLGVILSIGLFPMLAFYLPMGILDAILSGAALVALVVGRYPADKIPA